MAWRVAVPRATAVRRKDDSITQRHRARTATERSELARTQALREEPRNRRCSQHLLQSPSQPSVVNCGCKHQNTSSMVVSDVPPICCDGRLLFAFDRARPAWPLTARPEPQPRSQKLPPCQDARRPTTRERSEQDGMMQRRGLSTTSAGRAHAALRRDERRTRQVWPCWRW